MSQDKGVISPSLCRTPPSPKQSFSKPGPALTSHEHFNDLEPNNGDILGFAARGVPHLKHVPNGGLLPNVGPPMKRESGLAHPGNPSYTSRIPQVDYIGSGSCDLY